MAELHRHACFRDGGQQLYRLPRSAFESPEVSLERFGASVVSHVEQSEAHLANARMSHIKVVRAPDPFHEFVGHRATGLVMMSKSTKEFGTERKILHELRRELHEIPENIGAAECRIVRIGKNAVQCMSKLMQERFQFVESKQRRARSRGFGEVHRHTHVGATYFPLPCVSRFPISRHPSPTLF